jgi:adenylylsulfate reductase subunit B
LFPRRQCFPDDELGFDHWTIQFRNGNLMRFKFPIRTTPEGSIDPKNAAHKGKNLDDEMLTDEEVDGYKLPRPVAIHGK